jgi:hypothetical protein
MKLSRVGVDLANNEEESIYGIRAQRTGRPEGRPRRKIRVAVQGNTANDHLVRQMVGLFSAYDRGLMPVVAVKVFELSTAD